LLEVVIAVAVVAVGLVTLVQTQNGNIALVAESEHITVATLLAQRHMAELVIADSLALQEESGNFADADGGGEFAPYRWTHRITETARERLRQVEVTVSWEPHAPAHSVTLVTYVAERGLGPQ